MLVARELHNQEGAEGKEERNGDIARHISRAWRERYQAHHITREDEEEAGEQIGRVFLVALPYSRLDDLIHHIHHEHLDKADEATRCTIRGLALLVPAGAEQDAAQQDGHIDEHHGHRLGDRQVEHGLTVLNYLASVV